MKKMRIFFLISIVFIITTQVVIATNNGTPFAESSFFSGDEKENNETYLFSGESLNEVELENELNEVVKTNKNKNIMLWGKELDIKGEAKDLIMAAGANITSKALGSYAFMAASQLNISGEIMNDTFAVGNNMEMEGIIGRDLYALGNAINITGNVTRDVYIGGETLVITGNIGGDVKFAGDSIYISSNAIINGNLDLIANSIKVEEGAKIGGTLAYQSNVEEVSIPQNIKTRVNQIKEIERPTENQFISSIKSFLWWTIANFIIFAVVMAICPNFFEKIKSIYVTDTVQKYCSSFGWGLLSIILIPIISMLCILTFIGSAIGGIGLLLYILGYMFATVISGYTIANSLIEKEKNKYLTGFIGIIIIEVFRRLPVIGGFIAIIVNAIVFGTILKLLKSSKSNKDEVANVIEK